MTSFLLILQIIILALNLLKDLKPKVIRFITLIKFIMAVKSFTKNYNSVSGIKVNVKIKNFDDSLPDNPATGKKNALIVSLMMILTLFLIYKLVKNKNKIQSI